MKGAVPEKQAGPDVTLAHWRWTNFRVAMLCLWAFLLGASLVRWVGAIDAQQRWFGPTLGVAVSALGFLFCLSTARPVRDRRDGRLGG